MLGQNFDIQERHGNIEADPQHKRRALHDQIAG